jgi:hypothetical protein
MTMQAAMKLTEPMRRALSILPITVTMWGGKPFTSLPRGIRSVSTLEALRAKGLCTSKIAGFRTVWTLTGSGSRALSDIQEREHF